MNKFILIAITALLLLSACSAQVDTDQIATIVAATCSSRITGIVPAAYA